MALARTSAVALAGVEGHVIEVEADIENGLVALLLVGLLRPFQPQRDPGVRSVSVNMPCRAAMPSPVEATLSTT